jgi:DNA-binding NarL/FixJ family response regulator
MGKRDIYIILHSMNDKFKIIIFDRYLFFGSGIQSVLEKESDLFILKIIQNNKDLFIQIRTGLPHLLVIDAVHSSDGCIPLIRNIKINHPLLAVFVIANQESSLYLNELVNFGVNGIIFGDSGTEEVISAVRAVLYGNNYFPAEVKNHPMLRKLLQRNINNKTGTFIPQLSPRENEVLKHFAAGLTYKEIGTLLFISPRTVETHKNHIMVKLNLRTKTDIVKYALLNSMI